MSELERNAHCVAFQKDPEKMYHLNDPSLTIDSLFTNSDLRSIYYITKQTKNIV